MMHSKFSAAFFACFCLLAGANSAQAAFPDKQVHFIVGFAPGGGADVITRLIAQKLSEKWGKIVVVENREGADGDIASMYLARAKPDGYTIMEISNDFTVAPGLRKINYDPIKSFTPVTMMVTHPDILVVNPTALPVNSVQELVDYAKANPGKLNFGSSGRGSPTHMFMELLKKRTGISMVNISYQSMGPALVAMLGGEVQLAFAGPSNAVGQIKAGKIRALAMSTNFRIPVLPDVPTVAEAINLPDFNEGAFNGVLAPAGTPKAIVNKIRDDIAAIVKAPDIQGRFFNEGLVPVASSPEEFAKFLKEDIQKWTDILKTLDVQ